MVKPTLTIEKSLWNNDIRLVAGVDEVGRGAFAGPVVAAAVILPQDFKQPAQLADSKLLKPRQREKLAAEIKESAVCYSLSEISARIINKVGIAKAAQMAFRKSLKQLEPTAEYVLIDAFYIKSFSKKKQKAVKKGDKVCTSIAAASIVAKVYRDKLMKKYHQKYPAYGFAKHKGYGTKLHQKNIKNFGLTTIHRKQFIHFL